MALFYQGLSQSTLASFSFGRRFNLPIDDAEDFCSILERSVRGKSNNFQNRSKSQVYLEGFRGFIFFFFTTVGQIYVALRNFKPLSPFEVSDTALQNQGALYHEILKATLIKAKQLNRSKMQKIACRHKIAKKYHFFKDFESLSMQAF